MNWNMNRVMKFCMFVKKPYLNMKFTIFFSLFLMFEITKLIFCLILNEKFINLQVKSVHRHRVPCRIVKSGQSTNKLSEKLRKV